MRDFKKHFFETLIQLTILANVFRQNNHPFSPASPESDDQQYPLFNLNSQQSFQSQYTEPDLLFLQDNFNFSASIDNLNQENYRVKEVRSFFNELNLINRQNQQLSRALPIPRPEPQLPNIVLQPASAIYPSNNHKRIIDLSETRILLNSLELNANNNNSLRKEFEMDIELQMLIEQDIDQGIKNSLFYEQTNDPTRNHNQQQLSSNDLHRVKNNVYPFEENQKHQDILMAMKLHENQLLSERYKLFVEEDTGEIVYQINDHINNNNGSHPQVTSFQANNIETGTNSNYTLTKPVKELAPIDMAMKHKPNDERIVYTKPIFLSQTSVCKELNKLNGESSSASSVQMIDNTNMAACGDATALTASGPFPVLDQQMLNEYIEENLITDAQKTSFDIQQDLETASFLPSEIESLIPDVFEFDENFMRRFESNLTGVDLREDSRNSSIMTQSTNNIFLDQTVLSTTASSNSTHPQQSNNIYSNDSQNIDNQFYNQQVVLSATNQTRGENDSSLNFLTDQLDMSLTDIFRTFNGSQMTNSLLNNFTQFNNVSDNNNNVKPQTIAQSLPLETSIIKTEQMSPNFHNDKISLQGVEQGGFASNQIKHEFIRGNEIRHQSELISNSSSTNQQPQQLHQLQVTQQTQQHQQQSPQNRQQQEQSQIYSAVDASEETLATIRGLNHNHTYMDGAKTEEDSEVYHPYSYKNKLKKMLKNLKNTDVNNTRQQESRDQILLQENNINLSISHIVESSADEFNEIIKSVRLNTEQLSVVKDIRRRGKNKVAAQICRKRKIDSIDSLKEDVEQMIEMKNLLEQEQDSLESEIGDLTIKFESLYQDLMGNQYDMSDPIIVYMNNLKAQLNLNLKLKKFNSKNNKSLSSESTESENSTEYGSVNSSLRSQLSDYEEESNTSNNNNFPPQQQHDISKAEKSDESHLISSKNKKLKN